VSLACLLAIRAAPATSGQPTSGRVNQRDSAFALSALREGETPVQILSSHSWMFQ
jgi:hypothetical protein